ncbi:hypothetical protein HK098_000350 [Nowakowskiella sp. JEL0407]|nr:hypothetical protein HK098_000350 [Nowakowskiella sp. JEL0407]
MEQQLGDLFSGKNQTTSQRVASLSQFADGISALPTDQKAPLLLVILPLCKQLSAPTQPVEIRVWLLQFISQLMCKWELNDLVLKTVLVDCLEPLLVAFTSNDLSVIKYAVQCLAETYPVFFRNLCLGSMENVQCWAGLQELKRQVGFLYKPGNPALSAGIKVAVIAFWGSVALSQSLKDPNSIDEVVSLDFCPNSHPFLIPGELSQEADQYIEKLFSLMPLETEVVITSSINTIVPIARRRPQYLPTVVPALIRYVRATPPRQFLIDSKPSVQWSYVERTIKNSLMLLLRNPTSEPYTQHITETVTRLGAKLHEINSRIKQRESAVLQPSESNFSLKRSAVEAESEAKRTKLEPEPVVSAPSSIATPQPVFSNIDVTQIPIATAVEFVMKTFLTVPEDKWNDGLKILSAHLGLPPGAVTTTVPVQSAPVVTAPPVNPRDPRLRDPRLVKKEEIPPLLPKQDEISSSAQIVEHLQKEISKSQALLQQQLTQTGELTTVSASSTAPSDSFESSVIVPDEIEPFEPPTLDSLPSEDIRRKLLKESFLRMLELESLMLTNTNNVSEEQQIVDIDVGDKKNRLISNVRSGWMSLVSRFLTRGIRNESDDAMDEDGEVHEDGETESDADMCRKVLFSFILEDFRDRQELAVVWLHEEYFQEMKLKVFKNYKKWFHAILEELSGILEVKDRGFTKFLMDVPYVTDWAVESVVKQYCEDPERMQLGFSTLKDLINLRPAIRECCLDLLLEQCVHKNKSIRSHAILTAKRWIVSEHIEIAPKVESYGIQTLQQIKYVVQEDDLEDAEDNEEYEKYKDNEILRHVELYFAICSRKQNLLSELFHLYPTFPESTQRSIRTAIHPLIKSLLGNAEYVGKLCVLIKDFPVGSESLVLRILGIMTEKKWPTEQILNIVREILKTRNDDVRFLVPVVSAFKKDELLEQLPKIVSLLDGSEHQRKIVRDIFLGMIDITDIVEGLKVSDEKNAQVYAQLKAPMTPIELLVALHTLEDAVGLKRLMEATDICFKTITQFDPEQLAAVCQQISDAAKPCTLLMRSVIQSVTKFPALTGFINSIILPRMISKRVWTNKKLWPGWIKCAEATLPGSISVVVGLQNEQFMDVVRKSDEIARKIREWGERMEGNPQATRVLSMMRRES